MGDEDRSTERWKPVVGFEGFYSVSSRGRVRGEDRTAKIGGGKKRSVKGQILRPDVHRDGHLRVNLYRHGGQAALGIHRLVLEAFDGPCPEGMECRHLNGDPTDNRWPENIEWATHAENCADTIDHGTSPKGERHGSSKLTRGAVRVICRLAVENRVPQWWLGEQFGVSGHTVSDIKCGKTWGWATKDIRGTE